MRVLMRVGVFYEGRPLMPPEIHDLPREFARVLIAEGRAVPAPDEIVDPTPPLTTRDPAPGRGVRRR